ncbi:MAG: hypothetical protein C5B50_24360 [Verrucomicrobia bacterium]|nr:MAG: hypothetical protein C5B50_24360 [Verrucomicrobiota bacterium]
MLVPEGLLTIAQRFSVGIGGFCFPSPEGTTEKICVAKSVSRPFGTFALGRPNPTLKCWAILGMSLRDKNLAELAKGIRRLSIPVASLQ